MELSTLLTDDINIEEERWKLHNQGLKWKEIEVELNGKYRESSRKRLFRCKCCNSTTFLVLSEVKACCFKHESKEECAGSRNYTRYTMTTKENEHPKHRVGKAILKDQLQVSLSRRGAVVMDGYLSRSELKYVPDLIVEWPSGETLTFDYVNGTRSEQYQRYLTNKQKSYVERGFKAYFLFDQSQLARNPDHVALALSMGEKGALSFLSRDPSREELLREMNDRFGVDCLVQDSRLMLWDMRVQKLLYVNDDIEGTLFYISQLQLRPHQLNREIPDRWYQIVSGEQSISINELFLYDPSRHAFGWENEDLSEQERNRIIAETENRYQALQLARRTVEVEQRRAEEQRKVNVEQDAVNPSLVRMWTSDGMLTDQQYQEEVHESALIEQYKAVVEKMKKSSLIESNPRFLDRIRDCEDDLLIFEESGEIPVRMPTSIRMMMIAMGMPIY